MSDPISITSFEHLNEVRNKNIVVIAGCKYHQYKTICFAAIKSINESIELIQSERNGVAHANRSNLFSSDYRKGYTRRGL